MPHSSTKNNHKVKIIKAMMNKNSKTQGTQSMIFTVRIGRSQQLQMTHEQVKYFYPQQLIDFYQNKIKISQKEKLDPNNYSSQLSQSLIFPQHSTPQQCLIFNYDDYILRYGSKSLQYINTVTTPVSNIKNNTIDEQKIFSKATECFYLNFIEKSQQSQKSDKQQTGKRNCQQKKQKKKRE